MSLVSALADRPEAARIAVRSASVSRIHAGRLAGSGSDRGAASPAIIVVGQVATLADAMRETSGGDVVHRLDGRLAEDAREHVA